MIASSKIHLLLGGAARAVGACESIVKSLSNFLVSKERDNKVGQLAD